MTTTAQSIIHRVAEQLQDIDSVRWTIDMLVRYLNAGQRAILVARPDASTVTVATTLVPGARQRLPDAAMTFIDIAGNTVTHKALRKVDAAMMDALNVAWQNSTPAEDIIHFCYDLRFPRDYYVYPPALATSRLDLVYSVATTDIVEPASGLTYTSVAGNISVSDHWTNALYNYVMAMAWGIDAEFGGNAQLSDVYLSRFNDEVGIQAQGAAASYPKE